MASEHKNGLVFPISTGAVEHHKNMVRSLEPVMKAAKVINKEGEPKYALHAFRHYFASWCLNTESRGGLGLPPQDVQRLLGHSSIVMTLDVYGHLFPGGTTASLPPAPAPFLPKNKGGHLFRWPPLCLKEGCEARLAGFVGLSVRRKQHTDASYTLALLCSNGERPRCRTAD
jgi:integrase-like protein